MNLADSMKHVLKNKSQNIFALIVKEDFTRIVKDFASGILDLNIKSTYKNFSLKESFINIKDSIQGSVLLLKAIPLRVSDGFKIFSDEFMAEIDKFSDPKQKTVFCMKILAGLSKFAVSSAYDVGIGDGQILRLGKNKNVIPNIVISRLMFKTIQSFLVRLIQEMENEITDLEELKNLQNYKDIILDDSANAIDKFFLGVTDPNDRAFVIVDKLKKYILTGEQVTEASE
jgi:hypothetical protein